MPGKRTQLRLQAEFALDGPQYKRVLEYVSRYWIL